MELLTRLEEANGLIRAGDSVRACSTLMSAQTELQGRRLDPIERVILRPVLGRTRMALVGVSAASPLMSVFQALEGLLR